MPFSFRLIFLCKLFTHKVRAKVENLLLDDSDIDLRFGLLSPTVSNTLSLLSIISDTDPRSVTTPVTSPSGWCLCSFDLQMQEFTAAFLSFYKESESTWQITRPLHRKPVKKYTPLNCTASYFSLHLVKI